MTRVIASTLTEMRCRSTPFTGLLYAGLVPTTRGVQVMESNVRFGDPEIQIVLAPLETPLAGVLHATSHGELTGLSSLRWHDEAAVVVVGVVRGYPGTSVGRGNTDLPTDTGCAQTVHVGTKMTGGGLIAFGGWVLGIVGLGEDPGQACGHAYEHLS